ncbi:amidohydrolase [Georgenia sp. SYP-B2076]|uniref:amidohydrolase n=1 Tax=Georgenia sp. SYP-B2076 TaxID=2495881 RepID=UPI001F0B8FC9|nr:amidohydrolase family protein [Georgenia sp. SYP-B2076]
MSPTPKPVLPTHTRRPAGDLPRSLLVRRARLVPVGVSARTTGAPMDVRIVDGVVTDVGARLDRLPVEDVLEAEGRWAIPGLWDHHVHLGQWASTFSRLDLGTAASAAEALELVRARLEAEPPARDDILVGFGFRDALWPDAPSLAALDAVAGDVPVTLLSGDVHCGWLSSRARELLGAAPGGARDGGAHDGGACDGGARGGGPPDDGLIREAPWFEVLQRLRERPGPDPAAAYRRALGDAAARGVVGVTELEWAPNHREWPDRVAEGLDLVRVRAGFYAEHLDDVLATGRRTGDALPGGRGLVTMGALKIISDGSLNTRTAHCLAPYADPPDPEHPHGVQTVDPQTLEELLRRARAGGLDVAVHAIGDAAAGIALDAFAAAGARGSIEHAQLLAPEHAERLARLGVVASVQPAQLLDDRDVTERVWPGRADRSFPLRALLDAGATLAFGSDAPVAPLDPWLAMAAAVHRSADERPPWHPEQQITAAEALAASTDGQRTLAPGGRGDVVLLDADPLAAGTAARTGETVARTGDTADAAARLRTMRVAATVVAGRITHRAL